MWDFYFISQVNFCASSPLLPLSMPIKRKSKEKRETRKERSLGDRLGKLDSLGLSCLILSL